MRKQLGPLWLSTWQSENQLLVRGAGSIAIMEEISPFNWLLSRKSEHLIKWRLFASLNKVRSREHSETKEGSVLGRSSSWGWEAGQSSIPILWMKLRKAILAQMPINRATKSTFNHTIHGPLSRGLVDSPDPFFRSNEHGPNWEKRIYRQDSWL